MKKNSLLVQSKNYRTLFLLAFLILALDQLSKLWVLNHIPPGTYFFPKPIPVIKNFFYLVHVYNTGSAWGSFSDFTLLLAIFSIIVLFLIYFFRNKLELKTLYMQIIGGLFIGGLLGNLMDRIFRGHVIDFIDIHLPGYRWPAFNIADSAISLSVLTYIFFTLFLTNKKT